MNSINAEKRIFPSARRRFLGQLLALTIAPWPLRAAATSLLPTPAQMLGPFYPPRPDPAAPNDLTSTGGKDRARGTPLTITGRVLDTGERAQAEVLVEIWQTNAHGRYHHPEDDSPQPLDPNFRGYGRTTTGADGSYLFHTIMPVAYPGRTPHVHFRLSRGGRELLVTQMYLPGNAGRDNERDGLYMGVRDAAARARLLGVPQQQSGRAGNSLRFDIVLAARS